jgi:dihydrofolate reductase
MMKVIMVAVISSNGKLTRGEDPDIYKWTSREDQDFFFSFIKRSSLIVMGSGTYNSIKSKLKTQKSKLRIVLTRRPDVYKSEQIRGQLEFSSEKPPALVRRLSKTYKQMLLVGGSAVYSSFMKENLVDEIYLTIEPLVFGSGKDLFEKGSFESSFNLVSFKKLNKQGTLLLKYKIRK